MRPTLHRAWQLALALALMATAPGARAETAPAAASPATPAAAPSAAAATGALEPPAAAATSTAPAGAAPQLGVPYQFQPGVVCPMCQVTPEYPEGRRGLHWHSHWRSAGTAEYIATSVLAAAALGVQLFIPTPSRSSGWNSPILFDEPVRDALRLGSAASRRRAAQISDVLLVWETVQPTLIDPLVFAWWKQDAPNVAQQMLVIDAQAYSLTLLLNGMIKRLAARARPWTLEGDCAAHPNGPGCGSGGAFLSFYSGHAAMTATGAGLICAHHTQLSLYQNNVLDTSMCGLAVVGAALTGGLRIASDNHWASDVLVGHLVGYTSGYLLPTLLYYKEFRATPHEHTGGPTYAALPLITPDGLGVSLFGLF